MDGARAKHQTVHATSLAEQINIVPVGDDEFESASFPQRMGNKTPIAYGGCARAVAVHAACKTVKDGFGLYSVLGYFLGPAMIDRPMRCKVHRTRDTRTFATRRVVVSQTWADGKTRVCVELFADFQAEEPAVAMTYSPSLLSSYEHPSKIPTIEEYQQKFVAEGKINQAQLKQMEPTFALMRGYFEQRLCMESVSGQNMMGFAKTLPTTQDHLAITDKHSAEWLRARIKLETRAEQFAALAFNMDGGLSFLPLVHDHKFFDDAGACSSLDFAMRVFSSDLDLNQWHVKERKTIAAEGGRTFSEARLFSESGKLVAIETQQSIMRPLPVKAAL